MSDIAARALAAVQARVGVHEQGGNNTGPEVDQYLASVHLAPGNPWCAAFMFFCWQTAADALGVAGNPLPCTGSTLRMWAYALPDAHVQDPQPGDVYVLEHSPHTGHVGIVEAVENGAVASEISGNTYADGGGREGNCVARHAGRPEVTHGGTLLGYLRF